MTPARHSSPVVPIETNSEPVGSFMQNILDSVQAAPAPAGAADEADIDIAPKELPPGSLLHGYRLIRDLAAGGFGVTYLATEELLNRRVVIKEHFPDAMCEREAGTLDIRLRDPAFKEPGEWALGNFLREVRLLATIDHPNIAKVYSFFEAHNTAYYVTQYIDGKCLSDVAKDYANNGMPLSQDALYALMVRILDALDYLHSRKLLHRDIKPDNILVTRLGNPVLIDFGAAREEVGDVSARIVETTGYSPPEQGGSANGEMGPWTDLYAFGATLYYILTETTPAPGRVRLHYDALKPLCQNSKLRALYHPRLLAGIDKSLEPDISLRYHSVAEWMADLRELP